MRDVLVLCYHAVSQSWPSPLAVRPAQIEEQLEFLLGRGYRPTTFSEAVIAPPARRTLAVTFDDAFRSVIEEGAPILARLEVPATVFVPTGWVGGAGPMAWPGIDGWLDGPYEQELASLSWSQLRSLAEAGWEIGSHTISHPPLPEVDDARLARELVGSRRDCEERLGRPCHSIAYPYGELDGRVVRAVAEAGYRTAAALPVRPGTRKTLEWPRVGVWRRETFSYWRQKTAPLRGRLVGSDVGERLLRWDRRLRGMPQPPNTPERVYF